MNDESLMIDELIVLQISKKKYDKTDRSVLFLDLLTEDF